MVKIEVEGDADIVIRRRRKPTRREPQPEPPSPSLPPPAKAEPDAPEDGTILLKQSILDDMEIRVESIFRPNHQDDETSYAISGDPVINMLHKYTSSEVIKEATPTYVSFIIQNKIEYILKERGRTPGVIIDLHTHPSGIADLSEVDIRTNRKVAEIFNEHLPGCQVFFGVHAVSGEQDCRRSPAQVMGNKVAWSSITREHEVAFFDGFSNPIAVSLTRR